MLFRCKKSEEVFGEIEVTEIKRPPYLTSLDVANHLNCSVWYVGFLIKHKQLEAFKLGKRAVRVKPESLDRFEKCGWLNTEASGALISKEEIAGLWAPRIERSQSRE